MSRSPSHDARPPHDAPRRRPDAAAAHGKRPAPSHSGHVPHASHGAAAPDPREAVDVARSVATLMDRMRQLKDERDEAFAEIDELRAALPEGHPAKKRPAKTSASARVRVASAPASVADPAPSAPAADAASASENAGREDMEKALAERDEYLQLARRTQAELDNYRKRVQRDQALLRRDALKNFLTEFLGAFDDLDRVLVESEKDPAAATVRQGVQLVRDNLWRAMDKSGVKAIPALHEPFDPHFHDALTTIPSAEYPAHTVLEVFQPGYMLDDFVLRPARVVLSAPVPDAPKDADTPPSV